MPLIDPCEGCTKTCCYECEDNPSGIECECPNCEEQNSEPEHTHCPDCKTVDGCSCDEQYQAWKDNQLN